MTPLLGAESCELKPVVGSKRSDDLRVDEPLVDVGQRDTKDNRFGFLERIGQSAQEGHQSEKKGTPPGMPYKFVAISTAACSS